MAASFPQVIGGLKSLLILVEDIWLYSYDSRKYLGRMQYNMEIVRNAQLRKWTIFNFYSQLPQFHKKIQVLEYQKLLGEESEGMEEFILSLVLFWTFTLIQMVVICIVLWRIFECIRSYPISRHLRRFCYVLNYFQIVL